MNGGAKSVPILDIVRHYSGVKLHQRGREHWGCCPLHGEKTPSFSVNAEKNVWTCYGCHAGGSGVDFVMRLRDIGFREACEVIEKDFSLAGGPIHPQRPTRTRAKILEVQYGGLVEMLLMEKRRLKIALRAFSAVDIEGVPAKLVHLLGETETLLDELLTGNIEEKAAAMRKGLRESGKYRGNACGDNGPSKRGQIDGTSASIEDRAG